MLNDKCGDLIAASEEFLAEYEHSDRETMVLRYLLLFWRTQITYMSVNMAVRHNIVVSCRF